MNKNKIILEVVIIVILVLLIVYVFPNNKGTQSNEIKIGFIGPLTGEASSIGTVNKTAAEMAVEEVNAAGGINGKMIKMIYEDGQCKAQPAINAAQKLINVDGVIAVVGGLCSTETSAFGPMAMQNKVIVFSYGSSAPSLSNLGKYFFRSYPSDLFQGKFSAEYAYNTLHARKVAVLYHISDWGTGIKNVFEERFKALGGQIVDEEGTPQDAKDYRTELGKVSGSKPDLIYSPMYPEGTIVALTQANQLGIKTTFLGGDAWGDPKVQKTLSGKGKILFAMVNTPLTEEFKSKVLARTKGNEVPLGSAQAYDNIKILAQVMAQVGTDPDKVESALRQIQYDGVSGHITFDQNGDLASASYTIQEIKNGTAVDVK